MLFGMLMQCAGQHRRGNAQMGEWYEFGYTEQESLSSTQSLAETEDDEDMPSHHFSSGT